MVFIHLIRLAISKRDFVKLNRRITLIFIVAGLGNHLRGIGYRSFFHLLHNKIASTFSILFFC